MAQDDERPAESPTGDVEYDEAALRDAEKKMHAGGTGGGGGGGDPDPEGGHDPGALEDAAEKMGVEPEK